MWVNTNAFDESEPFFFLLASFSTKIFEVFKGLSFFWPAAVVPLWHGRRPPPTRWPVPFAFFFPFATTTSSSTQFLLLPSPPLLSPSCFCFFFPFGRGYVVAVFFLPFAFRSLGGVLRVRWQRKKRKKKRHGKGEASRSDREPRKPVLLLLLFLFFLVSSSPFGFFFSLVVARVRPRKREGGALNEKGGE